MSDTGNTLEKDLYALVAAARNEALEEAAAEVNAKLGVCSRASDAIAIIRALKEITEA